MNFSPEQFASLRRVLSDPSAKAAALVSLPTELVEGLLIKIEDLIKNHGSSFGNRRLLLRHIPGKSGGRQFDAKLIIELFGAKTEIVAIGDDATFLAAMQGTVTLPSAAAESEGGPCICMVCSAGGVIIFAAGKLVAEIGTVSAPSPSESNWKHSWTELRECLDGHFRECIVNEKLLRFWQDRKKRILLAGPDGTEKLFHHNVFWWCKNFIVDALDVYGEAQSMGQDKTDITVVTEVGNIVIEVKWLGINENNTKFAQVRIDEGLIQVADYLSRNGKLMKGYLVMYDARSEESHTTESSYTANARHVNCEEPVIYFLRSETPSERGVRLAPRKSRNRKLASVNSA